MAGTPAAEAGFVRGLTNLVPVARFGRYVFKSFHHEPVIVSSIILGLAGV